MAKFDLQLPFKPAGDQPEAIEELSEGIKRGDSWQTLLGVTGSGKTVTMAGVIAETGRPTLVMSHNKTLAAQLYGELRQFFPNNAVEYFISYYDYYQPEAYVPQTDTFIEKDASINEDIDRLRLRATTALMEREDVIVVASVSAIYGLGNPESYKQQVKEFKVGQQIKRKALLKELVGIQYTRDDLDFKRGTFRVRGDVIEIYPAYEEQGLRIEMWGDEIEKITRIDPTSGQKIVEVPRCAVFPASHYATGQERLDKATDQIEAELEKRLLELRQNDKFAEANRLEKRIKYDLEMIEEMGFCPGIENYARYLDGRQPGERPYCLYDYFPDDFMVILDESHVSVPQIGGMYKGDRSRKETLVEHGFRLPSALDNRPLKFEEWEEVTGQTIFVSATPGDYELEQCHGVVVEQVVRPTGLIDPEIEVRPVSNQVDDLLEEIRKRANRGERVLVTTLTKRMAEDLTQYLAQRGGEVEYMHSDIDSIQRVEILRGLRLGEFDVLVGINLLREGLDLPEVSLVAILDADKEGFLRSETSLIQTIGRAARHRRGKAILYADQITGSMQKAIDETKRRREIQKTYNQKHDITPRSIEKSVEEIQFSTSVADARGLAGDGDQNTTESTPYDGLDNEELVQWLEEEMREAAQNRNYQEAARLRDRLFEARAALEGGSKNRAGKRKQRSHLHQLQQKGDSS